MSCDHHPDDIRVDYGSTAITLTASCTHCGILMTASVTPDDWYAEEDDDMVDDPFACPGCEEKGTPEETRGGFYFVICTNPNCDYEDHWEVPIKEST